MTIDALLLHRWSQSAVAQLDKWRQGHLVAIASSAWMSLYEAEGGSGASPTGFVGEVSNTGFMAVVSQTCDVVLTGPGAKHPFVQVCPVHDISAFDAGKITQIKRGEIRDWVYLTDAPGHAEWAIDLRLLGALHKDVLAAQDPTAGFRTSEDEREIGTRLRTKFEREALPDVLSKDLPDMLRACLKTALRGPSWADEVEQLRLSVLEGTPLEPTAVQLMVITDVDFDPDQKKPIRTVWESFRKRLRKSGIESRTARFRTLDDVLVREYRRSIPIHTPELGRGYF